MGPRSFTWRSSVCVNIMQVAELGEVGGDWYCVWGCVSAGGSLRACRTLHYLETSSINKNT